MKGNAMQFSSFDKSHTANGEVHLVPVPWVAKVDDINDDDLVDISKALSVPTKNQRVASVRGSLSAIL
jgi:hypothetical protein